jgi:hypothetical protein
MARQGRGAWHGARWDGKTATPFPLNDTDETKAMRALLLQHPLDETLDGTGRSVSHRLLDRQLPKLATLSMSSEGNCGANGRRFRSKVRPGRYGFYSSWVRRVDSPQI